MTSVLLPAPGAQAPAPVPSAALRRIPPNLFAVSFGLSGLAQTWAVAARHASVPAVVAQALWILAGAVWLVTLVAYLRSVVAGGRLRTELGDHVFGPFVSVPGIVGLLLSGGLEPHAHVAGLALFWASLLVTVVLAGKLLAVWALDDAPSKQWHPGYYLPSVGGPIVAAGDRDNSRTSHWGLYKGASDLKDSYDGSTLAFVRLLISQDLV